MSEKTNLTATNRQIYLTRRSPHYWRVTINHPPLNIFGPDTIPQLNEIVTAIETDEHVKVVVFDSAIEGFFLTHYDFLAKLEDTTSLPPGPTGLQPLPDMLVRLSRAPVVSIASIRGRATGVGSELALACDMRFASHEKAILSHFEVGAGIVPGGGPMARLPRLIGRGRALEVFLGADDFPGDLAERYGYVNRSLPDAELDEFVDALANRIASFDKRAISETKRFVDVASLPPDYEIAPEWDVCLASIMRPAAQTRIKKLMEQGFHKPGDVENRLGYYVGQVGREISEKGNSNVTSCLRSRLWVSARRCPIGHDRSLCVHQARRPFEVNHCPQCASLFQVGLARADNERALQTGSIIRNQDRHEWRCSCRSYLQCAVRIFRRRETDCGSSPSSR